MIDLSLRKVAVANVFYLVTHMHVEYASSQTTFQQELGIA